MTCLALSRAASALAQAAELEASRSGSEEPASAERRENPSRFRDPQDGRIDLRDFLASSRGFLPTSIVIAEPAVGYGDGAVGMFLRPREAAGIGRINLDFCGLGPDAASVEQPVRYSLDWNAWFRP
jgi:hypothetical protein